MSSWATVGLSIGTLVLGWVLNEVSHRRHTRDEDRRELAREHRTAQATALLELQRVAAEYHATAERLLYAEWERAEDPDDAELDAHCEQLADELEAKVTDLFAVHARVDDRRIRSVADHLEEMGRQFTTAPGVEYQTGGKTSRTERNLWAQGDRLQGILWSLNNFIGSRLLDLVGVADPETPPYRGE